MPDVQDHEMWETANHKMITLNTKNERDCELTGYCKQKNSKIYKIKERTINTTVHDKTL